MPWKEDFNVKELKQNIFLHNRDTDTLHHPKRIGSGLKTRPTDEEGVWKGTKMYEISSDVFKPLAEAWTKKNNRDTLTKDDLTDLLGITDRLVFMYNDGELEYAFTLYVNEDKSSWSKGWFKDEPFVIRFALFSEMNKLELNKKEIEIIKKKEAIKNKVKFNNMVLKDIISEAFKKAGHRLEAYNEEEYRVVLDDYNQFIESAINFYVNQGLLKDLGCTVTIAKPSSRKGFREPYDNIIDMKTIDIEGEQNAETK